MVRTTGRKVLSVLLALCMFFSVFTSFEMTASAAGVSVEIVSFTRGAQADIRSSELMEARVTGYSGNVRELTYKWTSTLGTYLYVYNSHNMYGINNTSGEIEIYNSNISSSANMSGRSYKDSFTGAGYAWAAVYGADVTSSSLVGKVTVEVYDQNGNLLGSDSHEGTRVRTGGFFIFATYENRGFVMDDLAKDINGVSCGLFEGDIRAIKNLLGENAIVHITCEAASVPESSIVSGDEHVSLSSSGGDHYITGLSAGTAVVKYTLSKDNCKFHQTTSVEGTTNFYVYKKPTTTSTATAVMLGNLDDNCTYYIGGAQGTRGISESGEEIIIFEGLTPNTEYQVEVVGHTEGTDPVYAYVYETTLPSYVGTVEVVLNGSYNMATGQATGTRVSIEDVLPGVNNIFLRYEDSELYFELTEGATGVYSAVLSDGNYTIYSDDHYSKKLSDQILTIGGESRTRYLFFNSVTYNGAGGTNVPSKEYHMSETKVSVSTTVPEKEGYLFTYWTDGSGNRYYAGDVLTENINSPYTLTANYVESRDVYAHIKINHVADGGGHNTEAGKHSIPFTVDGRSAGEADYTELTHKTITWDGVSVYDDGNYSAQYISQNEEDYTLYTASKPMLTNVEKAKEYTITAHKSGYEIESVTREVDENGDLHLYATLRYVPNDVDLSFTVALSEEAKTLPTEYKPKAVNVKVTCFYDMPDDGVSKTDWYPVLQMTETYKRVELPAGGVATASFPVWMGDTQGNPYYYRVEVVSYERADGSILLANNVDDAHTLYATNDYRYKTTVDVSGGIAPSGSTLPGAYWNGTQAGNITATVEIEVFDVTFDPNGGTLNGSTANTTLTNEIAVPDLSSYVPTREGGYIFEGWHLADANGNMTEGTVNSGDELHSDIILLAEWREPITVEGTVTVAGTYTQFDEETGMPAVQIIPATEHIQTITVSLQRIDHNGYPETVQSIHLPLSYASGDGVATYTFTGVEDIDQDYRIKVISSNYESIFQNELSSSTVVTDYHVYDETHYMAEKAGDRTAMVNAYLHFVPKSFNLEYEIDATTIGDGYAPTMVETLILFDDGQHGVNPQSWATISQMVFGENEVGQDTTLSGGYGQDSVSVWNHKPDGQSFYNYAMLVKACTVDGEYQEYSQDLPYAIYYNGSARFDEAKGQTQMLTARIVPKMYRINFQFTDEEKMSITNMEEYLMLDGSFSDTYYWSYGTLITASPERAGFKFLGWVDENGNKVEEITPDMHQDITLHASWSQETDFGVMADAGYYAASRDALERVGVVALSAHLNNLADVRNHVVSFGIYVYNNPSSQDKVTVDSTDVELLTESSGYFHVVVSNINPAHFNTKVMGIAYVVLDGDGDMNTTDDRTTILGDPFMISVNEANKWLGTENVYE